MEKLNILEQRDILGKKLTIYGTAENPLFLAKEIAGWIEHSDVSMMLRKIDNAEKGTNIVCTLGGTQECWFLTEDGLYEVLMQSRKPIAKQFKSKVKEILRTIRKTGTYTVKLDEPPKPAIFTYRGRRVVTIKDIARVTNKREGIIQSNIRGKKAKLKEGTDFSVLRGNDLREFKRENNIMMNYYSTLTVVQFSGFKRLCKLWGIIPDETGVFLPQKVLVSLPVTEKKADSALTTKLEKQLIQAKWAVDALNVALDVYSLPDHLFREGMKDALSLMTAHVTAKVTNLLRASDQLQLQPKV